MASPTSLIVFNDPFLSLAFTLQGAQARGPLSGMSQWEQHFDEANEELQQVEDALRSTMSHLVKRQAEVVAIAEEIQRCTAALVTLKEQAAEARARLGDVSGDHLAINQFDMQGQTIGRIEVGVGRGQNSSENFFLGGVKGKNTMITKQRDEGSEARGVGK